MIVSVRAVINIVKYIRCLLFQTNIENENLIKFQVHNWKIEFFVNKLMRNSNVLAIVNISINFVNNVIGTVGKLKGYREYIKQR